MPTIVPTSRAMQYPNMVNVMPKCIGGQWAMRNKPMQRATILIRARKAQAQAQAQAPESAAQATIEAQAQKIARKQARVAPKRKRGRPPRVEPLQPLPLVQFVCTCNGGSTMHASVTKRAMHVNLHPTHPYILDLHANIRILLCKKYHVSCVLLLCSCLLTNVYMVHRV